MSVVRYAALIVTVGLLASTYPIGSIRYTVVTTLVLKGKGVVDKEVFSSVFRLAPEIQGWQRVTSTTLLVNSTEVFFERIRDRDGNLFAYPGNINFSGVLNLTLVQEVEVVKPPFRRVAEAPATMTPNVEHAGELSASPFWGCNTSEKKFSDVVNLARELGRDITTIAGWVKNNIKYNASGMLEGDFKCPARVLSEKNGSCGDIHALLTALLRLNGFDAFLAYAYVYVPGKRLTESVGKWNYTLEDLEPHIFTVVNASGTVFPVDVTANIGGNEKDIVRNSAINSLDSVILLAWIKKTNPDDFVAVYAPAGASGVSLRIRVHAQNSGGSYLFPAVVALFAALLLLSKERSLER